MDIAISRKLIPFIQKKTRSGQFNTPSDVVNFALQRMQERDAKLAWLRTEVQKGIESLDRGEGESWDFEETKARLLKRHERRRQKRT